MKHLASPKFWEAYDNLPENARALADKSFALLKQNPQHPSLHFKKVGSYWSARVDSIARLPSKSMKACCGSGSARMQPTMP